MPYHRRVTTPSPLPDPTASLPEAERIAAPNHMTPDEFRRHGRAVVERIARYMEEVGDLPVLSRDEPGDVVARMPERAPEEPEPFDALLADLDRVVLPGLTHWQSPRFFGFFPANASGPAILGDLVSSGLAVQGMLWQTSPACTEVEMRVLDWLVDLLDLPEAFRSTSEGGGVIQDTASSATLCALVAARWRTLGERARTDASPSGLVAYASPQAHSSVEKAMMIAGFGTDALRLVPTDAHRRLDPAALTRMVREDRAAGRTPFFCCATIGTTGTGTIDPVPAIAGVAADEDLWLHVDAAWAGPAGLCPELRHLFVGVDRADSYCFNPHKWMLVNFDCDCFWVRDRRALVAALSILPEYLRNEATASGRVWDYRDWHVPLGRRFRALKLWWTIRWYGAAGLRAHVREGVRWNAALARTLADHPELVVLQDSPLPLLCVRHLEGDERTETIRTSINASGEAFLTHCRAADGDADDGTDHEWIRVAIGGTATTEADVERLRDLILERA